MPVKNPHRYDNLLDNQRPIARKPMPADKRAAQFAPFAALTGYEDQIKETARLTDEEIELDGDRIAILDRQLQYLKDHLNEHPEIHITYYVPDVESHQGSGKSGGSYINHAGIVRKIDLYKKEIVFGDGLTVPIERIIDIMGELFET